MSIQNIRLPEFTITERGPKHYLVTFQSFREYLYPWRFSVPIQSTRLESGEEFDHRTFVEDSISDLENDFCMLKDIDDEQLVQCTILKTDMIRTKTRTGKPLKHPITLATEIDTVLGGQEAWLAKREEIIRRLEKISEYIDPFFRKMVRGRASLIKFMLYNPEYEFTLTKGKYNPFACKWNKDLPSKHTARGSTVYPEVMQLFTESWYEDFQKNSHEYSFTYRFGFMDELRCPARFWEYQRPYIAGVMIPFEGQPKIVRPSGLMLSVDWCEVARQPIRHVITETYAEKVKRMRWDDFKNHPILTAIAKELEEKILYPLGKPETVFPIESVQGGFIH